MSKKYEGLQDLPWPEMDETRVVCWIFTACGVIVAILLTGAVL